MGSIICTPGFPPAAIASSRFTARCASIWYGFFIATLSFSQLKKIALSLSGSELESRYFLRSTGHSPSGRACARPDPSGVPESGSGDHPGSGISGSRAYAAVGATGTVACETGAIRQRSIQPHVAGGVSRAAKTVLGTTYVGAGLFLCDGGRGGRGDDQGLY